MVRLKLNPGRLPVHLETKWNPIFKNTMVLKFRVVVSNNFAKKLKRTNKNIYNIGEKFTTHER